MNDKKKKTVISNKVWLLFSFLAALLVWYLLSIGKATGRSFPYVDKVVPAVKTMIDRGVFFKDIQSSMFCVAAGFGLGFERCVMYLTGMGNIRDVIPFPRTVNNCEL